MTEKIRITPLKTESNMKKALLMIITAALLLPVAAGAQNRVAVKTKLRFYRRPALGERCTVATWPEQPGRMRCWPL